MERAGFVLLMLGFCFCFPSTFALHCSLHLHVALHEHGIGFCLLASLRGRRLCWLGRFLF